MSPIDMTPVSELDPRMARFAKRDREGNPTQEGNELVRFWNDAAEHAERMLDRHFTLWKKSRLGPRLTELVRLAVANQTRCPICLDLRNPRATAEGVDEELIAAIAHPSDERLTERERLAVDFATRLAGDHLSIGVETYEALQRQFDPGELAELTMLTASFTGMGRVLETITRDSACPLPHPHPTG